MPWALQVVVHVERDPTPSHTDVLRAVASAVALTLAAFTAEDAPPHVREPTLRWRSGPIRKVVRRARGAGWTRQLAVPDVQVHATDGVEVAVHVPGPVDAVHPEVARLQVGGLTLPDPDPDPDPATPVAGPTAGAARLLLAPGVAMTTGKAAAQVGHAAQLVGEAMSPAAAARWLAAGAPVEVATATEVDWPALLRSSPVVVTDGGFTEVAPGTTTVVADLPPDAAG